jgi:hypothetical protein
MGVRSSFDVFKNEKESKREEDRSTWPCIQWWTAEPTIARRRSYGMPAYFMFQHLSGRHMHVLPAMGTEDPRTQRETWALNTHLNNPFFSLWVGLSSNNPKPVFFAKVLQNLRSLSGSNYLK